MNECAALPKAERERMAEQIFSEYKHSSPDEWAAQWAHTVGISSFDDYEYRNTWLGNWIQDTPDSGGS